MTHTPEAVRAALDASIAHWAENMRAQTPDEASTGPRDCALCGLFWNIWPPDSCTGCPIPKRTGLIRCMATPYDNAETALEAWRANPTPAHRAAFIAAATAMHDWLVKETTA